jgi:hypothetical protein
MRSVKCGYAYVNNPGEQAARFRDGWVFTGDLATWDRRGYVTIVGRKDDMIISGGENIHPVEVEAVLNEYPMIAASLVVGLPDQGWGEIVIAYVVPAGPGLTAAECDEHCLAHPMLANYKRPRGYRFAADLRRTATRKKMHYKVREDVRASAGLKAFERPQPPTARRIAHGRVVYAWRIITVTTAAPAVVNLLLPLGITVALEAALLGTATAVALLALPRLLLLRSARR